MSSEIRKKERKHTDFWRATRFLAPYKPLVAISIVAAFFVGLAFVGGMSSLLPIMQVLIEGETIRDWADRQVVEKRIDVRLVSDEHSLRLVSMKDGSVAKAAGAKAYDTLHVAGIEGKHDTLEYLSDPSRSTADITFGGRGPGVNVALRPVPGYLKFGRDFAGYFPTDPVWAIAAAFGCIACISVFGNSVKFFQEYLSDKAAISAVNDIRRRLYDHILHIPLGKFGQQGTSDVTSRLVQDCQQLQDGFKGVLGQSIQEPIKVAMMFTVALITSWQITASIILFGPLMIAIIKKFGKKMRRASRAALQSSSSMLGQIEGSLIGIRVVKSSLAERFERRRYTRIMDRLVGEMLHMARIDAFSTPVMEMLNLAVGAVVVIFSAHLVFHRHMLEKGQFVLVIGCLIAIADSLRRMSKINIVLQRANAAAARVFETLDLPSERTRSKLSARITQAKSESRNGDAKQAVDRSTHPLQLPTISRDIRFENLRFSYPGASMAALDDVSLTVPRGRSIAVVGRNGSGKTTLLAMLPRFYEPASGRILIDDIDVRDVTLKSLRGQISIVTQDSVIFPGTIAENIAYGHPAAGRLREPKDPGAIELMQNIEEAAKRAFAHDFITEKPDGYQTMLEGLGSQLSGGQKQRLCIARAILRAAPILILDEATSQVDAQSEHLIQQAIESIMHQCTTFVIAHRFSTIISADSIVVMDRGRIVGQGKHDELLRTCETYQQLYERQLIAAPG